MLQYQIARAKINLTLHVGQVITEIGHRFVGYHPLDSLVVFSDYGDMLSAKPSQATQLTLDGPFAAFLDTGPDNLVLKAYHAVAKRHAVPKLAFHLTKNLPVASGIGGGSANAAAALRIMMSYAPLDAAIWQEIAMDLGADVPVCLLSSTAIMRDIGQTLQPLPNMGTLFAVLVNPGVEVCTGEIFSAFDQHSHAVDPDGQAMCATLLDCAVKGRNDLQNYAIMQEAVIKQVLETLSRNSHCYLARMSGSGATCFGLFSDQKSTIRACEQLQAAHPHWWAKAVILGDRPDSGFGQGLTP